MCAARMGAALGSQPTSGTVWWTLMGGPYGRTLDPVVHSCARRDMWYVIDEHGPLGERTDEQMRRIVFDERKQDNITVVFDAPALHVRALHRGQRSETQIFIHESLVRK